MSWISCRFLTHYTQHKTWLRVMRRMLALTFQSHWPLSSLRIPFGWATVTAVTSSWANTRTGLWCTSVCFHGELDTGKSWRNKCDFPALRSKGDNKEAVKQSIWEKMSFAGRNRWQYFFSEAVVLGFITTSEWKDLMDNYSVMYHPNLIPWIFKSIALKRDTL